MSRIFISHSSKNNDWASYVRDWLIVNGWAERDIFLDVDPVRGIAAGQRWKDALQKAAHRCEAVLAVMTPQWLASDWCRSELNAAQLMGKKIFVLLVGLDAGQVPGDLREAQWVDLIKQPEAAWVRLKEGLKASGLDPATFPFPEGRPPYPGFAPLVEDDAAIFFGRDAQIVAGLDKMRSVARKGVERMVFILGASGSGKSSFLRAGLIPRLRRDDRNWIVLPVVRPERAAISGTLGFAAALHSVISDAKYAPALKASGIPDARGDLAKYISKDDGLVRVFDALRKAAQSPSLEGEATPLPTLVITIDQSEELFNDEGREEAQPFIALLTKTLTTDKQSMALLAMRSDTFPQVQRDTRLAAIPKETFTLDSMLEGSFRTIIEGPAALVRPKPLTIEPALTQQLLQDVAGQDALPLLAFTLAQLYDNYKTDNALTLSGYEKLGRIKGVIENTVNKALAEGVRLGTLPQKPNDQLKLVRKAFIPHLARVNSAGQFVRRVAARSEIPEAARPVVDSFAADQARLLVKDRRSVAGEETDVIEVAHEAVLREWKSLHDGLIAEREFLVGKSQLEEDVAEYEAAPPHMKTGALMTGNKLARTRDWLIARTDQLLEPERRYIEASIRHSESQRRGRALAAAAAFAFMTFAALFSFGQWIQTRDALKQEETAKKLADTERDNAKAAKEEADKERDRAKQAKLEADRQRRKAEEGQRVANQAEFNAKVARDKVVQYIEKIVAEAALKQADRLNLVEARVSPEGLQSITEFEIESAGHYDETLSRPTWPNGESGVTIGIGYDVGYSSVADLMRDWEPYLLASDLTRLKQAVGVRGKPARLLAAELSDISIPLAAAEAVFKITTIPRFLDSMDKALPQAASLPPNCGTALLSIVYNRGAGMSGERRAEMRNIRDHLASGELERIPQEIRNMKRLWSDSNFHRLRERRDKEAFLFEKCLLGMDSISGDLMRALDSIKSDAPDKAEQAFASAMARDPSVQVRINRVRAKGNMERGRRLLEEGNDEAAKAAFEQAAIADAAASQELAALWTEALIERGSAYLEQDDLQNAAAQFQSALERDPARREEVATAYAEYGGSLLEVGKYREAQDQFALAIQYSEAARSAIASVYVRHGASLLAVKQPAAAEEQFNVALTYDREPIGRISEAYVNEAEQRLKAGDDAGAADLFAKAVSQDAELRSNVADIYVERGITLANSSNLDNARVLFEAAQKYDPDVQPMISARLMPRIGDLLKQGSFDQARSMFALASHSDSSAGGKLEALIASLPKREGVASVRWQIDDAKSPDYRHLDNSLSGSEFELLPADIEKLIAANHFSPTDLNGRILLGLRGAQLVTLGAELDAKSVRLRDVRPDHVTLRSVLIAYDRKNGTVSAFAASTEPNNQAVYLGWQRSSSGMPPGCNLLPTGSYTYYVGAHRPSSPRPIPGAFVQRPSSGTLTTLAVLRSKNDTMFGVDDVWDVSSPADNIHPSSSSSNGSFSSFGTLTVGGSFADGKHTGDWAKFRVAAGLPETGNALDGQRIDLVLLTGLEAAIAASLRENGTASDPAVVHDKLERLRQGSRGPLVAKLRSKLGLPDGDEMDAVTVKAFTDLQKSKLGFADGILSPDTDAKLGLCIFQSADCSPAH